MCKQVTKALLFGSGSKLKNLQEFLAPSLNEAGVANVNLANPWEQLKQLQNPPLQPEESLGLVTAVGLAERGINYEIS